MLDYVLFVVGFVVLIKGADLLVDGASSIAKRLGISDLVIGLTIVAFGTSMPEFVVNIVASVSGNSGLAFGNIVGSNIANILLILGVAAVIFPITTARSTAFYEIPFSFLAGLVLLIMSADVWLNGQATSMISRTDGLTLLCFFAIFMIYIVSYAAKNDDTAEDPAEKEKKDASNDSNEKAESASVLKSVIFMILGLAGLFFGGDWIVTGAKLIARQIGLSETVIGLTVVAIGTSLPELATSAVASFKKNSDIAIGNVVGSNIFNVFWVLGLSTVIKGIPINESALIDLFVLVAISILLFIFLFIGKRFTLKRWQGAAFLLMYVSYTVYLLKSNA